MKRGKTTSAGRVFTQPLLADIIAQFATTRQTNPNPIATMLERRIIAPLPGTKTRERPVTHMYPQNLCPDILRDSESVDKKGNYIYRRTDLSHCVPWIKANLDQYLDQMISSDDDEKISPTIKGRSLGDMFYHDSTYYWNMPEGLDKKTMVSSLPQEMQKELQNELRSPFSQVQMVSRSLLDKVVRFYEQGLIDNFLVGPKQRPLFTDRYRKVVAALERREGNPALQQAKRKYIHVE